MIRARLITHNNPHSTPQPKIAAGNFVPSARFWELPRPFFLIRRPTMEATMNGLIYLVGLIVVVLVILSVLGLR
jgi:hypothetical protein